jgi:hypothetical protein
MYELVRDPSQIHDAVRLWRNQMLADTDGNMVLPSGIWGGVNDGDRPNNDMFVTTFRRQLEKKPNIVFIDIPISGINENVLGAVGVDALGKRWILRQGFLRGNGELGGVSLREFPSHTTLVFAEVTPRPSNQDRRYYAVACVDDQAEAVQSATAAFVLECDRVRRRKYGMLAPGEVSLGALSQSIRLAEGSPEMLTSYWRSRADPQQIIRRQTKADSAHIEA